MELWAEQSPVGSGRAGGANHSRILEVKTADDLLGPGAAPSTVPTDIEQSTGLERLEILGKMEGVDIFDMRPLDASRKGRIKCI